MLKSWKIAVYIGIITMVPLVGAVDLGTYKGCAATDADFERTELVPLGTTNGPLKMSFDERENSLVDIYFIEKSGNLKKYDAVTKAVTVLGKINCATGNEDGLVGIALDPNFKTNRTLFVDYSFLSPDKTESTYRISRFKLGANGLLDMASEKILIKIPSSRDKWHTAGSMLFDAYGDLWMAIGDNEQIDGGPGNTADLRGGISRIHPDESAQGYSIPKGNFGEVISARFKAAGNASLAAEYADIAKVRPELYVKGTRNAYSITVDPVRRWLAWGDVGPDQGKVSEENNLVKEPYYMGWPYFAGEEDMAGIGLYGANVPAGNLRTGPLVKSNILGVKQLPAIREPIFKRNQGCAMTGPIFRYDGANSSPYQFPPQFDRKWMISGCDGFGFHLLSLDAAGETTTGDLKIFGAMNSNTLVDLKQGPDGALYYVNYGRGIDVIKYKGSCKDPALLAEKPNVAPIISVVNSDWLRVDANQIEISLPGFHEIQIVDIQGRTVMAFSGGGEKAYSMTALSKSGLYHIRVKSEIGTVVRKIFR
jgi:hypothetical protein